MAYDFEMAKVTSEEVKSLSMFMLCRSKIAFLLVMFVLVCFNLVNTN
jgi:hypothetical protein